MLINNSSTTSKRSLWPPETSQSTVVRGAGTRLLVKDNGNVSWMDDWAAALGAVTLGYGRHLELPTHGNVVSASLPVQEELIFAEEFCQSQELEAVRFFKTGSDAVSCAVRLARAYTGRPQIIVFDQSYHGCGDWHGPNLWTQGGIVDRGNLVVLPFGQELANERRLNKVAAVVVEPVPKAVELPPPGWLQHLRTMCNLHGMLLISDEVILGYRAHLWGYLTGVESLQSDLRCLGKALAQGAPLSALGGPTRIMRLLEREVHYSGTNNGDRFSLTLARQTLKHYLHHDVCAHLDYLGSLLRAQLADTGFTTRGLNPRFEVEFSNKMAAVRYCWQHGILFPGFCSMMTGHTQEQMGLLVNTLKQWRAAQ